MRAKSDLYKNVNFVIDTFMIVTLFEKYNT